MNGYLNYIIEANLILIFFIAIYLLLFNRESNFSFRRWYLLFTIAASLLFPFIEFPQTVSAIPTIREIVPMMSLPEITVGESPAETAATVNYWNFAVGTYCTVVTLLFVALIIKMTRLIIFLRKSVPSQQGKFRIIESTIDHSPFSFFHYIFIGRVDRLTHNEKELIIQHEKFHAHYFHSLDLLISEALKIAFWFNPVTYMMRNQFISIHEYQADEKALGDNDADTYCELLARASLASAGFSLANHFQNSLTLKRIVMINTKKTKMKNWKYVAIAPIFAVGLALVACQDQVISEMKEVAKSSTMVFTMPVEVSTRLNEMETNNPNLKFIVIKLDAEGQKKFDDMVKSYKSKQVAGYLDQMTIVKPTAGEQGDSYIIIGQGVQSQAISEMTVNGDIYTIADEATHPKDDREFKKYFFGNLRYPKDDKLAGIQGKVYVEFVVEKDGTLSNIKIAHGVSPNLDAEAIRIMSSSPSWEPGRLKNEAIRQRMILPVNFKIDGKPENLTASVGKLDGTVLKETTVTVYAPLPNSEGNPDDRIYQAVEQPPTFTGGLDALKKFIAANLEYPDQAKRLGVAGRVFVSFVVNKQGKISNVELVKGIGAGCDDEALKVASKMPDWNPGKQEGENVNVSYVIPIDFTL